MTYSCPRCRKEFEIATMDIDHPLCIFALPNCFHPKCKRDVRRYKISRATLARKLRANGAARRVEMKRFRRTNYYVSKEGDVYSTSSGRFLKSHPDAKGYRRITLQGATYRLHRLVYETWVGRRPPVVHHKDGDPTNNSLDNLEGLSLAEHSRRHMPGRGRAPYDKVCLIELPEDLAPFKAYGKHRFSGLFKSDSTKELYRRKGGVFNNFYRIKKMVVSPTGRMCLRVRDDKYRLAEIPVSFFGWV